MDSPGKRAMCTKKAAVGCGVVSVCWMALGLGLFKPSVSLLIACLVVVCSFL